MNASAPRTATSHRVGLLGAGYIVDLHAKALQGVPGVEVTAVCDRAVGRAKAVADRYGIANVSGDLADLLTSDVDAVHVLLPPDFHVPAARQILEAGKHVLLEKPMGVTGAECADVVALADARGLTLGVSHNFLFVPGYEALRNDVRAGVFGPIDHLTVNWLVPLGIVRNGPFDNWILRETKNTVLETGPHLLAFVFDLLGGMDEIHAMATNPTELPTGVTVYRSWSVAARYGQTTINVNLSMTDGFAERTLRLRGRAGSASLWYDRNLYLRDFPKSQNPVFDHVLSSLGQAGQSVTGSVKNFAGSVKGTLAKTTAANAYSDSFQRSLGAFYQGIGGRLDERLAGSLGVRVIEACESIVASSGVANTVAARPQPVAAAAPGADAAAAPTGSDVLVIGGSGFIGHHLVEKLVARGHGVRVVSRDARSARHKFGTLPVDLVEGSLSDAAFLDRAMDGVAVVYHLAKAEGKTWADYQSRDVDVTRTIAEAALRAGVKRFIYTGTIDSYYSADASDVIDNRTPLDPKIDQRNLYARSKAACETLLQDLHRTRGLPLVIFRPGVVIGKGCPPAHWGVGMFHSEFNVQYWGDGENKLPLVLVDDVAEALALGLDTPGIEGRSFLLTDEPFLSAREYVAEFERLSGTKVRAEPAPAFANFLKDAGKETLKHLSRHPNRKVPSYRDWDCRSHRARYDSSETRETLGWKPAGSREALIAQGIAQAVAEQLS